MPELVTLGEAMLVVRSSVPGRLGPGSPAVLSFAGAEATVAIGACRLGHTATWIGRVGTDTGGDLLLDGLRGTGVDVTAVTRDPDRATGLLLRHQRTADRVVVDYYRDGLAGSRLEPDLLPDGMIESARILHVTGITPALGSTAEAAVRKAILRARGAGVLVSFDVNYRSRLWAPDQAGPVLRELAEQADVIFASVDEAELITGTHDPLGPALRRLGPREVVIKRGAAGATVVTAEATVETAAVPVSQVDPVGAGDAFVAGYLSGLLDGLTPARRLHRAAACGAVAASTMGDWEGLATRADLLSLDGHDIRR